MACFSNFNVKDSKQFITYYQKVTEYFEIREPIFDPKQVKYKVTPHSVFQKKGYGNRYYLVPMISFINKSSVTFRLMGN